MSYFAAGAMVVGAGASIYSASKSGKSKEVPQDWFSAYGEKNQPIQGAIDSRDYLFGRLNDPNWRASAESASGDYTKALRGAATDPRLSATSDYSMGVLRGDYLNSPTINRYANQAAGEITAAGADQAARTQGQFARGGMGFSTGMGQALQAARASAAQKAATVKAGILANNYQNERGYQMAAPGLVNDAVSQPLNYLSQVAPAMYQPLSLQSGITTQLLGSNGQASAPTFMAQPSGADRLAQGISTAGSLYDIYSKYRANTKPAAA